MAFDKDEFKEAVDYSQIAYLACLEPAYEALYNGDKNYPSLEAIIKTSMGTSDYYKAYQMTVEEFKGNGKSISDITIQDVAKYSTNLSDADKRRINELSPEAFSYKIQDVYNVNDFNGFYACMIDKGDGELVVGIRGCENARNKDNLHNDWEDSAFNLLQNVETPQQIEVRYLLRYLRDTHQLDDYDRLTFAGHSLGGNLSSHAAVAIQDPEFDSISSKLHKTYNLDGPGVSQKYLEFHKNKIEKVAEKDVMQHISWSVVGNLLFPIPGSNLMNIKVNDKKLDEFIGKKDDSILGQIKRLFCKHTTECITPENGNEENWKIELAEKDGLSKLLGNLSRTVDVFVPEPITYAVGKVSSWLAELLLVREEGNKFPPDNVISNPQTGKVPGELSEDALLI